MPLVGVSAPIVERATINEDFGLYTEVSPGGLINTPGIHLNAIEVTLEDMANIKTFQKSNAKFPSAVQRGKSWSQGSYRGILAFNDWLYVAESALGRSTITSPTNNGIWVLSLGSPTAGTFTLSYGGVTTTAIAYNATGPTILAALEALSTLGPGCAKLYQTATNVYTIEFAGPFSTGGALTVDGSGLTGGTVLCVSPSSAGLGVYRWTYTVKNSGTDAVLTYQYRKGLMDTALEAEKASYFMFDGIQVKINENEATMNGNVYARKMTMEETLVSASLADVALAPVHMDSIDLYIGRARTGSTGPELLLRAFDVEFELQGKQKPIFTVGSDEKSFTTHIDENPGKAFRLTVMKNSEGRAIREMMYEGDPLYVVIEAKGPDIITGYPYRWKAAFPVILESDPNTDVNGAASLQFTGQIAYDAGLTPVFTVDTPIASF